MKLAGGRAFLSALSVLSVSSPSHLRSQLAPPSTGGVVALDRLLQSISEQRRVLVIGAHPDDEDTDLLAYLSLGLGAQTAYLSLNRGEGGQNLIGPELGTGLGIIRSQELVAARELDGATQYFTRAYDYGFSRTLDEALQFYPRDSLLKDVVRVIRRVRPHVLVSIFTGTSRDGHGQHIAAGWVTPIAFAAAADSTKFPELQTEEGLLPWRVLKLYRSSRFNPQGRTLAFETGQLDPRTGRSYHQIAMASRSRHRSQDMGQLQRIGPEQTGLQLVSRANIGAASPSEPSIFDGVPNGDPEVARVAGSLRRTLGPTRLAEVAAPIAGIVIAQGSQTGPRAADPAIRRAAENALAIATGLVFDVISTRADVVPGQQFEVEATVYNGGTFPVDVERVFFTLPFNGRVEAIGAGIGALPPGTAGAQKFQITVADDAAPSQPYFLRQPVRGAMYDWSGAAPVLRGVPFQPPLSSTATVKVLGATAALQREVTFRTRDQAVGEIRQAVQVVPLVDVKLEPQAFVWPADGDSARPVTVTLRYNGSGVREGGVRVELPQGRSPPSQRFAFTHAGQSATFTFPVARPAGARDTTIRIGAVAEGDDGRRDTLGVETIAYPHIRPTQVVRRAASDVRVADIKLARARSIGYVRGASDRVPEALARAGLTVTMLTGADLAHGDLSRFDAVVIGSRAYETDSSLVRHNGRVLEYARNGGLVVVQYQQQPFVAGGFAALPITIANPHDRVTDETVPVRVLDSTQVVVTRPNQITEADWNGWPQERGLYFANTWDSAYQPVLEMSDPNLPPLRGGLLVGKYGAGTYVYTGLSFFRALPAGVPGAFKLFMNLLSLNAKETL